MNEDKPSRGIRAGDIRTTKSAPAGLLVTETETDEEGESVVDWSKGQQLSDGGESRASDRSRPWNG